MTKKQKLAVATITAIAILATAFLAIPRTVSYTVEAENVEPPKPKLTHPQELWLAVLEWCESGGRPEIKVLDSNDKYSYGSYQFQMDTFLSYGKQYSILPQTMTAEEAESGPIYDWKTQRSIAQKMVENRLEYHWKVCYRKIGDYPKDTVQAMQ